MRGKNNGMVGPYLAQHIQKTVALGRVKTRRRLIHNDQFRVIEKQLGNAETLFHAA
ncbi:hypothetical protein D9M69_561190 [compost metagenome]